ncbi:unnamed protein product [Polarella glacialis]|uniref:Uncharacterized protein n=1 Tax=Polarella glacialis TaxID=89957 RepID=A0A813LBC2_POLGL|nr:unnamed protein product [Polarella glacialis]CAE8720599.1 unnamed protein product [Polarella glacialis]
MRAIQPSTPHVLQLPWSVPAAAKPHAHAGCSVATNVRFAAARSVVSALLFVERDWLADTHVLVCVVSLVLAMLLWSRHVSKDTLAYMHAGPTSQVVIIHAGGFWHVVMPVLCHAADVLMLVSVQKRALSNVRTNCPAGMLAARIRAFSNVLVTCCA